MRGLEIIPLSDREKWNQIVKSFTPHDIYYFNEYVSAYQTVSTDSFLLIYYCGEAMRLCYIMQQSDISDFVKFNSLLEPGTCYDWSTPYGYGGPLVECFHDREMRDCMRFITEYCRSHSIVSQFIRFHPLLDNHRFHMGFSDTIQLKKTVFIDTADMDTIFRNMDSKNRNMVRKARKNGIEIVSDTGEKYQKAFYGLYHQAMDRKHAANFYFFNQDYFHSLFQSLSEQCSLFSACCNGEIISSAIILKCGSWMHYHLSATDPEYKQLAPNNLLLYTVACRGAENGYTAFHLGGGMEPQDSLFAFKRSFHKAGLKDFYIGRNIFCEDTYQRLLQLRLDTDPDFSVTGHRLIQYRA